MDYLALIKQPIEKELNDFIALFNQSLSYGDGLLSQVLAHIRQRGGKRMRPLLMLLIASNYGRITHVTQHAAVGLELLHTASLVHDDVVDESSERRGQASVNATYNNKVAVLVGDYILSTALLNVSLTGNQAIVQYLAELGRTLAAGEILQLSNIQNQEISEEVYYQVKAGQFGQNLGMMFQIRDDIFDYFDSKEIGKPTGNDMMEGKLTLPVIYALNHTGFESMHTLAKKVKSGTINADEIAVLVEFTKQQNGIEYAEQRMADYSHLCFDYIQQHIKEKAVREALTAYVDYVVERNY